MKLNFIYALLTGIVPSLVWLFFWNREDHEQPEPRSLLAGCFLGGMIAVFIALILEKLVATFIFDPSIKYTAWAGIEEIIKFLVVLVVAIKSSSNDEPIDIMIYCITVALGFAAMENAFFILDPLSRGDLASGIITGNLRFMGATLVHVVSSGFMGFALSLTYYKSFGRKFAFWVVATVIAITVHAAFNINVLHGGSLDVLKAFGWIWAAVVIMIVLFEEAKAVRPRLV